METPTNGTLQLLVPLSTPDEVLIDHINRGEKRCYEVIIRKYNQRLYRITWSYVKNDADVKDVMQESYMKAYENLKNFKGKSKFSTWLTKIFINTALTKIKQKNKGLTRSLDLMDYNLSDVSASPLFEQSEEQRMIRKNVKALLENSIGNLPEKYRIIFMMREVEGISVTETAELLNISVENVKVRLHRAKSMLKNTLKGHMKDIELFGFYLDRCNLITSDVMAHILAGK